MTFHAEAMVVVAVAVPAECAKTLGLPGACPWETGAHSDVGRITEVAENCGF